MDSKDDLNLAYVGCIGCQRGHNPRLRPRRMNKGQLAGSHHVRAGLQLISASTIRCTLMQLHSSGLQAWSIGRLGSSRSSTVLAQLGVEYRASQGCVATPWSWPPGLEYSFVTGLASPPRCIAQHCLTVSTGSGGGVVRGRRPRRRTAHLERA